MLLTAWLQLIPSQEVQRAEFGNHVTFADVRRGVRHRCPRCAASTADAATVVATAARGEDWCRLQNAAAYGWRRCGADARDTTRRPSNVVHLAGQLRSRDQLFCAAFAAPGSERATSEIHEGMRVVAVRSHAVACCSDSTQKQFRRTPHGSETFATELPTISLATVR